MLIAVEDEASQVFSAEGLRWPGLYILSGHRTAAEQNEVNPDFPQSLHRRCPSVAVDLRVGDLPASATPFDIWAAVGQLFKKRGGRWGWDAYGDGEENHFDLGDIPPGFECHL